MSKKDLTLKKHNAVRNDYAKMASKVNANGKRIYTHAYIVDELSGNYYLTISTIEKIIYSKD